MDMAPNIMAEPPPTYRPNDPSRNLRNPLPLSASQEAQVRDIYYKKVRSQCADEIKGTPCPDASTSLLRSTIYMFHY